jgi:hypothetical protein
MKKMISILMGAFLAVVLVANVQAQNPHLTSTPVVKQVGDSYVVSFQAAGLGGGNDFLFTATMDITQQQYCTSNGKSKQRNSAGNPCTASGEGSESYGSVKNGNLKGSITVPIEICQEPVDCPGKQQAFYESFWANLEITVKMPNDGPVVQLYPF